MNRTRPVAVVEEVPPAWREDFSNPVKYGKVLLPEGWDIKTKPRTKPADISVKASKKSDHVLYLESDDSSSATLARLDEIDLNETPILRWRWRATVLPQGADGRNKKTDDQAMGIYVGTGNMLRKKSVSYHWDTVTPDGSKGKAAYGAGTVLVKWYTLRNEKDIKNGQWCIEERNCAEDFKESWGFVPKKIYISIACNSQYTGGKSVAELDWIEFDTKKDAESEK